MTNTVDTAKDQCEHLIQDVVTGQVFRCTNAGTRWVDAEESSQVVGRTMLIGKWVCPGPCDMLEAAR